MMTHSEQINELAAALAKAQGEMGGAVKDAANPFYKSKYADLASVWEACRKALSDNGLCVVQSPSAAGNAVSVETILAHSSGQWMKDTLTAEAKDSSPQAVGSAITYLRRYQLQSIAGVAPEDDDGEGAQGRGESKPQAAAKPKPAPAPAEPAEPVITDMDILRVGDLAKRAGYKTRADLLPVIKEIAPGVESLKAFPRRYLDDLAAFLEKKGDDARGEDVDEVFGKEPARA